MSLKQRIQDAAEQDALVIGTAESLKQMDALDTVVVASNAPRTLEEKVEAAADDSNTTLHKLRIDNGELGSLCMKPFTASVVGITQ